MNAFVHNTQHAFNVTHNVGKATRYYTHCKSWRLRNKTAAPDGNDQDTENPYLRWSARGENVVAGTRRRPRQTRAPGRPRPFLSANKSTASEETRTGRSAYSLLPSGRQLFFFAHRGVRRCTAGFPLRSLLRPRHVDVWTRPAARAWTARRRLGGTAKKGWGELYRGNGSSTMCSRLTRSWTCRKSYGGTTAGRRQQQRGNRDERAKRKSEKRKNM